MLYKGNILHVGWIPLYYDVKLGGQMMCNQTLWNTIKDNITGIASVLEEASDEIMQYFIILLKA